LQILMNRKKINKEYLIYQFKSYLRTLLFGTMKGITFLGFACLFRNIFGKFHHYTVAFLPAFACGFSIMIEEKSKQQLYSCAFLTLVSEYVARQLIQAKIFKLTRTRLCVCHMISSSAVMYLLRNSRGKQLPKLSSYWFFEPPKNELRVDPSNEQANKFGCYHEEPCWIHNLKSSSKYLGAGLALELLRALLKEMNRILHCPLDVLKKLLKWKTFSFGIYLGSYVFLYHLVNCLLYRYNDGDMEWHAIPAGFIAGAAIVFCPNLSLFFMATTTIIQELIKRGISAGIIPPSKMLFVFCFAFMNGILYHSRLYNKEICSSFVTNMIDTCSGDVSRKILTTYEKLRVLHEGN
ncbi:hypothetical protein L9F63_014446, partial [Diploptera punctata]